MNDPLRNNRFQLAADLLRDGFLTGGAVRMLMRRNGATIRSVAAALDVSMARVRQVREYGVDDSLRTWEWVRAIHAAGAVR